MPNLSRLIAVFEAARELVARPDNDFTWSSWQDRDSACAEIDDILKRLRIGDVTASAAILFAPTGPIQELSLSSGWGDRFLELADEYDSAMAEPESEPKEGCTCRDTPSPALVSLSNLEPDRHYADIAVLQCPRCGQKWLRYHYENEAFTRSGRWFLGAIEEAPSSEDAKATLEGLPWYFAGGSYYDGNVHKASGPILL